MPVPQWSIIIPTHNRPKLLARAVRSVTSQWRKEIELLVVDDSNSAHATMKEFDQFDGIRLITLEKMVSAGEARNVGIKEAKGEWISFLDDDDELCNDFFSSMNTHLNGRLKPHMFAWCGVENIEYDSADKICSVYKCITSGDELNDDLLFAETLLIGTGWGLTVHRSCFASFGCFNPLFQYTEDSELLFRMLSSGCRPIIVPECLVKVHLHNEDVRITAQANYKERLRETIKIHDMYDNFHQNYPTVRKRLQGHIMSLKMS